MKQASNSHKSSKCVEFGSSGIDKDANLIGPDRNAPECQACDLYFECLFLSSTKYIASREVEIKEELDQEYFHDEIEVFNWRDKFRLNVSTGTCLEDIYLEMSRITSISKCLDPLMPELMLREYIKDFNITNELPNLSRSGLRDELKGIFIKSKK